MGMPACELAIWEGAPLDIFPKGAHVFPADLDAVRELVDVLREDLRETHLVSVELVARAQRGDFDPGQDPSLAQSLSLPRLRDFLVRRRPAFDRAAHRRIAENTLRYGRARIERLRSLGAPGVLIDHASTEVARVDQSGWSPTVDVTSLLPSAVATASVIDIESRAPDDLFVNADITDLVLLAAQCCTPPDANDLGDAAWLDELEWLPLAEPEIEGDAPIPSNVVRVRGAVYQERVDRLEFAIVPPDRATLASARALLAVTMPNFDE
ncbi:MAG: hypothetical protein K0S65_5353 [Labilithrix sp.]|nr:hypothetical protein [Labilithrix sp.]